ncbi:MAG: arginase family protein, partial [Bacteroidales bacterium]
MNDVSFDPGGVGVHNGNYFGFPWKAEECDIVIVNVPWDATTSYRRGTARGPEAMIKASTQLDFYSFDNPGAPLVRCGTDNTLHERVLAMNETAGGLSAEVIEMLERGCPESDPRIIQLTSQVNKISGELESLVHERCRFWIGQGKGIIIAGGEHSVPLGHLRALAEVHSSFGILQIDAHADLRLAYEGFEQSHA